MGITDLVRRTLQRYRLLPASSRVAVALSGGADSVALLHVLRDLAVSERFELAGAVHVNHLLRGEDADGDEAFCRDLAARLGVPIEVERIDVARLAAAARVSMEQAAHVARYECFDRAAARLAATAVAVAHTKDDQAETFLLRLLRGAGPRGLGGMHPRSGLVVRPFIDVSRADVRAFLAERRVAFRHDASNDDVRIPRNRIRHELLPLLEERFAPAIVDVLDRAAAIAREDAEFLESAAVEAAARIVSPRRSGVALDVSALRREPAAIARRVVRLAQQAVAGDRFLGFDAVESVLRLLVSKSEGQVDLPGHRVKRLGSFLVLTASRGREKPAPPAEFNYLLEVPGLVEVPEAACAISAVRGAVPSGRSAREIWRLSCRSDEAVIEAGHLAAPLSVRRRRPGDAFRPLGLGGRKKLQDLFVDKKIGRAERDATPVIADSAGRIIWVAGHALAEEFRVTDTTRDVVILKRVPI